MSKSNIISIDSKERKHGGARPGAGRKPGAATANPGRFIYILHEADEPSICKIGIANNPYSRLSAHQVSTWRRLKLSAVFTAGSAAQAATIERATHKTFSGLHETGEWFRVSPERAIEGVLCVAESHGFNIEPFNPERDLKRD